MAIDTKTKLENLDLFQDNSSDNNYPDIKAEVKEFINNKQTYLDKIYESEVREYETEFNEYFYYDKSSNVVHCIDNNYEYFHYYENGKLRIFFDNENRFEKYWYYDNGGTLYELTLELGGEGQLDYYTYGGIGEITYHKCESLNASLDVVATYEAWYKYENGEMIEFKDSEGTHQRWKINPDGTKDLI